MNQQPDFKAIKKRIEDLITRDYLERDKDNPNLFRYLAWFGLLIICMCLAVLMLQIAQKTEGIGSWWQSSAWTAVKCSTRSSSFDDSLGQGAWDSCTFCPQNRVRTASTNGWCVGNVWKDCNLVHWAFRFVFLQYCFMLCLMLVLACFHDINKCIAGFIVSQIISRGGYACSTVLVGNERRWCFCNISLRSRTTL